MSEQFTGEPLLVSDKTLGLAQRANNVYAELAILSQAVEVIYNSYEHSIEQHPASDLYYSLMAAKNRYADRFDALSYEAAMAIDEEWMQWQSVHPDSHYTHP